MCPLQCCRLGGVRPPLILDDEQAPFSHGDRGTYPPGRSGTLPTTHFSGCGSASEGCPDNWTPTTHFWTRLRSGVRKTSCVPRTSEDDRLLEYDPGEPRDWRGRWTYGINWASKDPDIDAARCGNWKKAPAEKLSSAPSTRLRRRKKSRCEFTTAAQHTSRSLNPGLWKKWTNRAAGGVSQNAHERFTNGPFDTQRCRRPRRRRGYQSWPVQAGRPCRVVVCHGAKPEDVPLCGTTDRRTCTMN